MKTRTQRFTVALSKSDGADVQASNGNLLAVTTSGDNVWFPAGAKQDTAITYRIHEKGEKFTANADSKRTKGEVLTAEQLADLAKTSKKPVETLRDEPLYYEGEEVVRLSDTIEFVGFAVEAVKSEEEELSMLDKKAAIFAKHGIKVSLG